jgi:LPXTG-motif cell wall-anchored protein
MEMESVETALEVLVVLGLLLMGAGLVITKMKKK